MLGYSISAQQIAGNTSKKDSAAGYKLPVVIKGQDTFPVYMVEDTRVEQKMDPEEIEKQKEWNRMVYNVIKVYPYAMAVANKMQQVDSEMAKMDKRHDRKEFLKNEEERIKTDYAKKIQDLTPQQGVILAKLISRQTGKNSYSLIREYKSGITAFFWQGIASVYGVDLKAEYSPNDEPLLESVLQYLGK
jgi:hypothetical protein